MYRKVFPRCEVEGSLEPVAFSHFGSTDHIPRKCAECENMFEGECVRAMDQVEDYLSLDYGPCRKSGLCNPVLFEDQFIKSKVFVPEKCRDCFNLKYHAVFGFRCHEDDQIWGRYGKTLDWGHWSPDLPNIDRSGVQKRGVDGITAGGQRRAGSRCDPHLPGTPSRHHDSRSPGCLPGVERKIAALR